MIHRLRLPFKRRPIRGRYHYGLVQPAVTWSRRIASSQGPTVPLGHTQTSLVGFQRRANFPFLIFPSVIVANQSQTIVPSYGYSGVVGLGTNGRKLVHPAQHCFTTLNALSGDGKFNETLAGNWLSQHPESSNFTYGLALNGPHTTTSPNDGGEMHLLAPDPSAFTGDITWMPMSAFNSNASDADFYIDMDSWVFQSSEAGQLRQSQVHAIVDPFLAPLRFPSAQARAICKSFMLEIKATFVKIV